MKNERKIIILITIIGALIFSITLFKAFFYAPTDEIPLPIANVPEIPINKSDPSSFPIHLSVPKINIDTNIQEVGITKAGNMGTPNNFTDAGWFKYGPLPGEQGSAVIAGHVDNGVALPAVFYHLNNLVVGDDIYVTTKGDTKLHFVVSKLETFDFNAKGTNVFTENDGKLLKLITCAGTWVSNIKTHDKRLVVTAILSEK